MRNIYLSAVLVLAVLLICWRSIVPLEKKLKLGKVKIDFDRAMGIIEELRKAKYPGETPNKVIVLLQDIDGEILWNITYLTNSFNIWNVKVDAADGKVKSEKLESVIQFKKPE